MFPEILFPGEIRQLMQALMSIPETTLDEISVSKNNTLLRCLNPSNSGWSLPYYGHLTPFLEMTWQQLEQPKRQVSLYLVLIEPAIHETE